MNILIRVTTVLCILLLMSCQEYGVELRIENASTLTYDQVSVNNVSFGSLAPNAISEYLPFESIYSSEFIKVEIGDEVLKLVPDTFNKEEFYQTGKYKFVVDIIHQKWLIVKFEEEK